VGRKRHLKFTKKKTVCIDYFIENPYKVIEKLIFTYGVPGEAYGRPTLERQDWQIKMRLPLGKIDMQNWKIRKVSYFC
jgi:hypothetical protein